MSAVKMVPAIPANSRFDLLRAVNNRRENWKLLVRVVRYWHLYEIDSKEKPYAIEVVLQDSQGTRISANLKKSLFYKFENSLCEGVCYYLSNLQATPNLSQFRSTPHAWKLNFKAVTVLKRSEVNMIPNTSYTFTAPNTIWLPTFDRNYLIDVMGIFTGMEAERKYTRNGVTSTVMVVQLDNMGFRFNITLFGDLVSELKAYLIANPARNVVIVVTFAKLRDFQGEDTLQSSVYASKLLINPDIPEAEILKNSMPETLASPSMLQTPIETAKGYTIEKDFLKHNKPANIQELKSCTQENTFVVYATVNCLAGDGDWWYQACKCNKKGYPDENMYFCEKCNRHVLAVTPRYLLRLRVVDETGDTVFVLFDRDAALLLGKSASDLIETPETTDSEGLPKPISDLMGRSFLFKVHCDGRQESRFERTFRVRGVEDDEELLQKFRDQTNTKCDGVNENSTDLEKRGVTAVTKDLIDKFEGARGEETVDGHVGSEVNDKQTDSDRQVVTGVSQEHKQPESDKQVVTDVSQHLQEGIVGAELEKTVANQGIQVVDISGDDHQTPAIKRPYPFVNDKQHGEFKMLKEIKKEKE